MSDMPVGHDHGDLAPGLDPEGTSVWHEIARVICSGSCLRACSPSRRSAMVHTNLIWGPGIPVALAVLAVAQIGVHLVFFLHLTTAPDNTNNVLALAFGVLIVALIIGGSLWIMDHLDTRMMPMDQIMQMQR